MKKVLLIILGIIALYELSQRIDSMRFRSDEVTVNGFVLEQLEDGNYAVKKYTGRNTSIVIPETYKGHPITTIRSSALGGLVINDITISKNIATIEDYAFANTRMQSITIPANVTKLSAFTFSGAYTLEAINVDENNPVYSSTDGVLYNKDKTVIIRYPEARSADLYTILPGVTTIGVYAFANEKNLKMVTIPDSVTTIEKFSFTNAQGMTMLMIPESVTEIGESAFSRMNVYRIALPSGLRIIEKNLFSDSKLGQVTIPDGVAEIGSEAFKGTALKTIVIPDTVVKIGDGAFSSMAGLTDITIPKSVQNIGDKVFANSYKLTSVTVDAENPAFSSIDGVLFDKGLTKIIYYPAGKVDSGYELPDTVTLVTAEAFMYTTNLRTVTLPASVDSIGDKAFIYTISAIIIKSTTPPVITGETFANYSNYSQYKIYVPAESVDTYKTAGGWPDSHIYPDEN